VLYNEQDTKIPVLNLNFLRTISDFEKNDSTDRYIEVQITKSNYFALLKSNRKQFYCDLTISPTTIAGDIMAGNILTTRYRAYLHTTESPAVTSPHGDFTGTHLDDLGEICTIMLELRERGYIEFRQYENSGTFRNHTLQEIITGLLSTPIKALEPLNLKNYSVTMDPPDNSKRYYQLVIPQGVKIINLPIYVQKTWGLYNAGIGNFLHNNMWYLYPLYDITRYDKVSKRMTIINVPKNEALAPQNSYGVVDNEIYVYATGDTFHIDSTDRHLDSVGSGIRMASTGNVVDKFTTVENGNLTVPKNRNANVFYFDKTDTDIENVVTIPALTSNPYATISKNVSKLGNKVIVVWENSNPALIYPGMPIKFVYKFMGNLYSLNGIIIKADTQIASYGQNPSDKKYLSTTALTLFTERAVR
jgi:hypothetical protein